MLEIGRAKQGTEHGNIPEDRELRDVVLEVILQKTRDGEALTVLEFDCRLGPANFESLFF